MSKADLLYVPDIAEKFGMTESAVRAAVTRDQARPEHKRAMPPSFRRGVKLCWRSETVEQWLKAREGAGINPEEGSGC